MASIGEETDRLSGLTEELLLLAAADEQRLSLSRESVKLRDLLAEVAERGRGRAQLQGRTITVQSDETMISADRQRLEYALGNLLDNALTHGAGECGARSASATARLLSCTFVIMGVGSRTAISPIRSSASPQQRAPDGAPGWAWPSCRRSPRPTAAS